MTVPLIMGSPAEAALVTFEVNCEVEIVVVLL
jgi:hypothetical protein